MILSKYVDPTRCFQLVTGVVGIYVIYILAGIIHESMYTSLHLGSRVHTSTTSLGRKKNFKTRLLSWCFLMASPG